MWSWSSSCTLIPNKFCNLKILSQGLTSEFMSYVGCRVELGRVDSRVSSLGYTEGQGT